MSFLAPLFLLGALAVSLPVVFHLIRRTTRERTQFSSLMFLLPSPPRLTRRSRLENILLLVLRCTVIGLLALGFARPFFKRAMNVEPSSAEARRLVVLVDASASMRRADLWTNATARVEAILRQTSPLDQVALSTFDRQVTPVVTFEEWNGTPAGDRVALAKNKLSEISPGWSATHLGNALISAAEALADTSGKLFMGRRQIVLVSDLQEGSRLEQLQGYEWPKGIEVTIEPLKAKHVGNAGLQLVTSSEETETKADAAVRVRVSNAPESKQEQFRIGWAQPNGTGLAGKPIEIYVPPGQSRIVPVPVPATIGALDRIVLQGDEEGFDNIVFVLPPEQASASVVYLGADVEGDTREPLYYVQRAFQKTQRQTVRVVARAPNQPVSPDEMKSASLFIITGAPSQETTKTLREQVTAGKTLLMVLDGAATEGNLARLLGLDHLQVEDGRVTTYAMLAEIDFRHPLLAPFADPRFSDFTKIHFWKYRRLDPTAIPGARVLAKFDSGDPAILETSIGKGHVLVLTSGWRPQESQLALSTKFVPLLYSMLELSGGAPPVAARYQVGDLISLASLVGAEHGPLVIRTPDGQGLNLAVTETNFSQTTTPGIYSVVSLEPQKRFAVNLDPSESRTSPLAPDELERLGVPLSTQAPPAVRQNARQTRLQNAELENRQKLWRTLLLAALTVLLLETWLAGRTARRAVIPG
jgi:hypothetical protein